MSIGEVIPGERELGGRISGGIRHARAFIHRACTRNHRFDVEALECRGEKSDRSEFAGATADPIPHRKTCEPLFFDRNFIELAVFTGDGNGVSGKRGPRFFPEELGFNQGVTRLGSAA